MALSSDVAADPAVRTLILFSSIPCYSLVCIHADRAGVAVRECTASWT